MARAGDAGPAPGWAGRGRGWRVRRVGGVRGRVRARRPARLVRRLAFLLALPLGLVGLYIRLRVEETPGFQAVQRAGAAARTPLADPLRTARREVVVGFGLVAAVTATFNVVFLPSHLATTGRAPLARALVGLRYSGLSLTYGLASALFGGTAPALATFLVRRTAVALAPAWYLTVLVAVATVCILVAPETGRRDLPHQGGID